jgi:hypothetical protein
VSSSNTARRWEKKASALGRALSFAALFLFTSVGLYILRKNHIIVFALIVADLIIIATYVLRQSGVYELVIDAETIHWGWAGVRDRDWQLANRYVTAIDFHRRQNGTGMIQLTFENGTCVFLPAEFTEQPGVADEILAQLREVMPEVPVSVL